MKKLRERWNLSSNFQLFIIILVFAITGSSAAKLAAPICDLVGLAKDSTKWFLYWPVRILIIFPIYQILLVCIGFIFGQFEFFWNFEKKMLRRLGLIRIED